ncbi:hypothetical protein KIW84_034130 [Lathyrus oleraceus]|nr:hypothetical protein KIW84_034130 [Pisum sativum]
MLLSPVDLPNHTGTESHLISQAPLLNVLLVGISSIDCVHIFSLHGLVPLLAAGLMLICEVFGSCVPDVSQTIAISEELSPHEVFSNAFTLLLRFWRFDILPIEQVRNNAADPPLGSLFSPEYLLLVRNCRVTSFGRSTKDILKLKRLSKIINYPKKSVFMNSFPKLYFWYKQHQECIASIRSGLLPGGPVYQIVDALLSMMFWKLDDGSEPLIPVTLGNNGSSGSGSALDDALMKLSVPAWDILEAVPYVLDASLNACAHGRISTRELSTGIKDLADFIPASLVAIASYFSAEVTRGIWEPAFMNGVDWPNPAANLSIVEQQIKKTLADTGVNVPSLDVDGDSPAKLPLPLAALVSLSITYKFDKGRGRFLVLIAPVLTAVASGCPWPCMPVLTSLWIQKVRRWSDYFVLRASGTVFHHNRDAVVQLLKSCFTSTLGFGTTSMSNDGGVGALLGHGLPFQVASGVSPVAPGILYLKVYRSIGDITFLNKEIMSILMLSVRDLVRSELSKGTIKKTKNGMKCGQFSFFRYMACAKHAALLGASLIWISGGQKLVQSLIIDTVTSWFLSANKWKHNGEQPGALVAKLSGHALAYFVMLSAAFAWGIDHYSVPPNQRALVIGMHLEFLATILEKKASLCCHRATWQAYVSGFLKLMLGCTPRWVQEVDVELLKRLSKGLRGLNEDELALSLLEVGGIGVMGAAAEMIIVRRL